MKVILADKAGACYGVNRSLEMVTKAASESNNVATLGALIHNPVVVEELETKYGVRTLDNVSSDVDTIVIRSHGVTLDVQHEAEKKCKHIVDATCPHVKAVQRAAYDLAKKYGQVIVVGKEGHPEVESVRSYVLDAGAKCYVWQRVEDIVSLSGTVGVVSQTTQSQETFQKILDNLSFDVDVENTICAATQQRQDAALKLSYDVDTFVVIGGRNSSNTTHLAEIVSANCPKTYHIETLDDLAGVDFCDAKTIGVTAGASTPKSQIEPIVEFLKNL